MKRLVYTPKVDVYIKADTGVYDLSPYVTACTVDRKINQISTATVTFRNSRQMFTEHTYTDPISKKTVVGPIFHPMDPIVIAMTRIRNRPIQVFTGFCDTTPYLQLHPGTVTLQASCTLKRLTATYWDPGLPFMQDWLVAHGWAEATIGSGGQGIVNTQQTKKQGDHQKRTNDAGLGKLLYDVLHEIGGWPDKSIYIEPLPPEVVTMVTNLYERDKDASEQSQADFQALLHNIIGSSAQGGGGGTTGGGGTVNIPGHSLAPGVDATPTDVATEMLRAGFPADPQIIANGLGTMFGDPEGGGTAPGESGGRAIYNGSCCYGYWQLNVRDGNSTITCANDLACSTKFALQLWKGAGNCFACKPGPNPWEAGTDTGVRYLSLATQIVNQYTPNSSRGGTRP